MSTHNEIKFAGKVVHIKAAELAGAPQPAAAPATCPKCTGPVSVSHKHGADRPWYYCRDRRSCGWKSPADLVPSLPSDDGLTGLKAKPGAGFDGLRQPGA